MKLDFSKVGTDQPDRTVTVSGSSRSEQPGPPAVNPLDAVAVKTKIAAYIKVCQQEKMYAQACKISNDADEAEASNRMLAIIKLHKKLEALRLSTTKKTRDFGTKVNSYFKVFTDDLLEKKSKSGEIDILDGKLSVYKTKKEFNRRKE
jgi:hypothetical protein